ncbi:hypothetical protein LPJ66_006345 [Kickxella alabastrina]|uniref:Uncharacterized protein n=1 Tax=Kickxella alabastrina TaxID=61397 RepID=A0ACC1IFU3_9FUNG|nr:hypothetical protein LPJ66_006345 [Kickxella alabastrina]
MKSVQLEDDASSRLRLSDDGARRPLDNSAAGRGTLDYAVALASGNKPASISNSADSADAANTRTDATDARAVGTASGAKTRCNASAETRCNASAETRCNASAETRCNASIVASTITSADTRSNTSAIAGTIAGTSPW